jgi:hypothetical protein
MLSPEKLRSIKRALALIESARAELRGLDLPFSKDLAAANHLVTAHVELTSAIKLHTQSQEHAAGAPLKAPLREQSV